LRWPAGRYLIRIKTRDWGLGTGGKGLATL
jgi:hypothetical protein